MRNLSRNTNLEKSVDRADELRIGSRVLLEGESVIQHGNQVVEPRKRSVNRSAVCVEECQLIHDIPRVIFRQGARSDDTARAFTQEVQGAVIAVAWNVKF